MRGILGKKIGMTRFFDNAGTPIVATILEAGPCTVVQVKTEEKDGYNAVQLGFGAQKEKRVNKPLLGHFRKANVSPFRVLREFKDLSGDIKEGDLIEAGAFGIGDLVNITGKTKGRGFAGVVKRWNFSGGPKTHGQSDRHRAPGSIGQSSYPKRVFKGMKMGGRMGNDRRTLRGVSIVKVLPEKNLIFVKGSVPGSRNGIVEISG